MYPIVKRFFDLLLSSICLLILSPILIPVVIGLKFSGEGFIFYKQERVGYQNKRFFILKFATMLKDSPNMAGGIFTSKKDPRFTPMGPFLRKSKINELPQLFNIFLGQMSFVGPRPVMPVSFAAYPEQVQKVIYNVKPGLSGIGSIVFRDEEELIANKKALGEDAWAFYTDVLYPFKGKLEEWYQERQSFMLDLKILFATFVVVVFPHTSLIYRFFKGIPLRQF